MLTPLNDIIRVNDPYDIYLLAHRLETSPAGKTLVNQYRHPGTGHYEYWLDIVGTNWFVHYDDLYYPDNPAFSLRNAAAPGGKPWAQTPDHFGSENIARVISRNKFGIGRHLSAHEKHAAVIGFLNAEEKERRKLEELNKEGCPEDRKHREAAPDSDQPNDKESVMGEPFKYVKGDWVCDPRELYRVLDSLKSLGLRDITLQDVSVGIRRDFFLDIQDTNLFVCYDDLSYKTPAWVLRNAADPHGDAPACCSGPKDVHLLKQWYDQNKSYVGPRMSPHEKHAAVADFLCSMEKERKQIDDDGREGAPEDRRDSPKAPNPVKPSLENYALVKVDPYNDDPGPNPEPSPLVTVKYFAATNHFEANRIAGVLHSGFLFGRWAIYLCDENNRIVRQLTKEELETDPDAPLSPEKKLERIREILEIADRQSLLTKVQSIQDVMKK